MSTKQQETNRRGDVVRCEVCGEDYSVTYKRCPFCDGKQSADGGVGSKGKRLVTNKRGGGYGGGLEPVHIIGIALSVILIIAALYIVYTVVSPLFGFGKDPGTSGSSSAGISSGQSQPGSSQSGAISTPGSSSGLPIDPGSSSGVITPIPTVTGITLSSADFTLQADKSHRLVATLTPADCTDTVVWSSSDESLATVTQDGVVLNVNKGTKQGTAIITAKVGDLSATCYVRCKPGSVGGGGSEASGKTGVVTASSGLRIRSGPGTTYSVQGSASNGAVVTILEDAGDGWYKISYTGVGGKTETGYVSKDYIQIK